MRFASSVAAAPPAPPAGAAAMPEVLARRRPRLDPQAPLIDNIARVIGAGLTTRLIAAYGGHRLYIPQHPAPGDPIAAVVGHPAALRLGAIFGGERVWLPNAAGRRNRIRIAELRRAGATVAEIASALECSERYVYKVLRRLRDGGGSGLAPPPGPRPPRPRHGLGLAR